MNVQCEDGIPAGLEIATFGLRESYAAVVDALKHLGTEPHDFSTVVIDSIDKLEPLIFSGICASYGYTSIESPGFGKGYVQADTLWLDILRACDWLRRTRGMTIVCWRTTRSSPSTIPRRELRVLSVTPA